MEKGKRSVDDKTILDKFVEDFCSVIENHVKYIVCSGFVAIAHGRTRGTEDIDMIIEEIPKEKFIELHNDLNKNDFVCMQSDNPEEVYENYLKKGDSVRYVRDEEGFFPPEMEIKFPKDELDEEQLNDRTKLPLTKLDIYFSGIESNIAFKEEYLKSDKDIEYLSEAGKILSSVLDAVVKLIRPGVKTIDLDREAEKRIRSYGALPAFKGYRSDSSSPPYPTTLCTSVNDEVVHTPASGRELVEGDIIGIDAGLILNRDGKDYYSDMARTVGVGRVSSLAKRLMKVAEEALYKGIHEISPGNTIEDIGRAVQIHVETNGFSVVRTLVGHGVGFAVHEDPRVPNYADGISRKIIIQKGMVLAIEPMVNTGDYDVKTLNDGWTIVTQDGGLSAHFEHSVAVTERGHKILTQ